VEANISKVSLDDVQAGIRLLTHGLVIPRIRLPRVA